MISPARSLLLAPVLLFSLAACGLKGPLYLPDQKQEDVPESTSGATGAPASGGTAVTEGRKVRTLPPAPQSQKKDREQLSVPATPTQSGAPPVSPPDPDRPATPPPPRQ